MARITPAGLAWLEAFRRPTQAAMAAVFRGFTPAELTHLRHLCLRLVEHRLPGFLQVVTGVDMISELYGECEATLVYDVHTATPAGTRRTAEHFRLNDTGITSITLIFDGTPWQPMLAMMGQSPPDTAAATP